MRLLITAAFLALAAWFVGLSGSGSAPFSPRLVIDPAQVDRAAPRAVMGDPPTTRVAGLEFRCMECHGLFPPSVLAPIAAPHDHVVLDHGLNDACDNCHSRNDRTRLVLYGGSEIGYGEVERLCAKCHGPTFRDWQMGIHGKAQGSWDPGSSEHRWMRCTECHDPHRPAMGALEPLPPPPSPRMQIADPEPRRDEPASVGLADGEDEPPGGDPR